MILDANAISALAEQHRLPIVTKDKHFEFVDGLKLINWENYQAG